jgi:hypothetical protein
MDRLGHSVIGQGRSSYLVAKHRGPASLSRVFRSDKWPAEEAGAGANAVTLLRMLLPPIRLLAFLPLNNPTC